jgi:hypothetical protein
MEMTAPRSPSVVAGAGRTYHRAYLDYNRVPQCKQKWRWFLVWPVLLTPGFQSAIVEGTAYNVAIEATPRTGVYLIPEPDGERRALAARIAADPATTAAVTTD